MTGLCGRARKGNKGNTIGELGCTTSHLMAIRQAVDANSSRYYMEKNNTYEFIFPYIFLFL